MAGKAVPTATEIVVGDRLLVIAAEQAFNMPQADVNGRGIVLVNERVKVNLQDEDGTPVEFTCSVYLQRAGENDEERAAIAAALAVSQGKKDDKAAKEAATLAAEKKAMFALGQESTVGALKNIATFNAALETMQARLK